MAALSGQEIELLAEKKLQGTITPEENRLLEEWLQEQQADSQIVWDSADADEAALKDRLLRRIKESVGLGEKAPVRKLRTMRWWAAAAVLLLLSSGSYFFFFHPGRQSAPVADDHLLKHDVSAPVASKAMVILSNGNKIYLDSLGNGSLATQDGVSLVKLADGQLAYYGAGSGVLYNTLYNPKGSKAIHLTLSDGTKVWLNAESSLKYPVTFTGNERKVEINGEGYFEVATSFNASGSAKRPFIVKKGETEVVVLGTHFNVNAYDDEEAIKVTLLEGSVVVNSHPAPGGTTVKLRPGEQAIAAGNSPVVLHRSPDIEQVMAWKHELFLLKEADIKTVMRQLARWYDVEVEYKGEVKEQFIVEMDRNTNVSNVFKILEATGGVHFSIDGRKITVMP